MSILERIQAMLPDERWVTTPIHRGYTRQQLDELIDRDKGETQTMSMSPFDPSRETLHVQIMEPESGDEHGNTTLEFDAGALAQLLFLNLYHIKDMTVEDGKLKLTVRYTGVAMRREAERALCWSTQLQKPTGGVAQLDVVPLPRETRVPAK